MRHSQNSSPQVNAGSMADIAFLLLIFFLVATTISADKGINRKLPPECPPGTDCSAEINERNILRIELNSKNELMVDGEIIELQDLREVTKAFLDNNGNGTCTYCNGNSLELFSDHPKEAVVSLTTSDTSNYAAFIAAQDELSKAYYELREVYCYAVFGRSPKDLNPAQLKEVKEAYPFILSEAETK
ncbi:biopolymer transport protein ExbD [Gelidibacter algens]|uniref:Biopolymer transport protein ExbD n=1 Tax=Gelidibacter algens TaxID=49280 RepID=A0A1A7R3U3_9FLAO|nr:biopolymer transporter ExbD [Gelidibacter algens]OBX26516.1 biopolymer transporter ExbD [Gelidibacter algens]RAJ26659.1 biopolymer transport protein ExbD [Gelidibacter algens]